MSVPGVDWQQSRDPGLQAERTALSWSRTGWAILANALLALRSGWVNQAVAITSLAFALLATSGVVMLYGGWRRRQLSSAQASTAPPAIALATVTVITWGACVTAIASITTHC